MTAEDRRTANFTAIQENGEGEKGVSNGNPPRSQRSGELRSRLPSDER